MRPIVDNGLIRLTTMPVLTGAEAYVEGCKHEVDTTVYFVCHRGNKKYWKETFERYGIVPVVSCVLSHEWLHITINSILDDDVSVQLDNLFGQSRNYKTDYHGVCRLKRHLHNYRKRK